jgi:hypothetical protein
MHHFIKLLRILLFEKNTECIIFHFTFQRQGCNCIKIYFCCNDG